MALPLSYRLVSKHRFRILKGEIKDEVEKIIRMISDQDGCVVIELNVQEDYVHLLVMIPPKLSISNYVGIVKRQKRNQTFFKIS